LERRVHELEKAVFDLRGGWQMDVVGRAARQTSFDEGLRLDRVWEERHDDRRLILVEYTDERRPEVLLGFWWDVAAEPGFAFESDQEVAVYLKIWLEEAFHAGGPLEQRPVDADGRRWIWPGAFPPPLPPGR
jgi:hypothetical protein